jgi:hypothetical protein
MPTKARSFFFFPRRKEGEDAEPGPLTRHICVNYEVLERLFHLPLKDAASEIGLCQTTFKKACRMFDIQYWPSRKRQNKTLIARRNAHANAFDAAISTLHQEPVCALAAPALQTPMVHQDKHAGTVTCTSPVWHDGSIAWRGTSAFYFSFSANASSSSTVRASSELPDVFSSAAPEGLLQQASMALDTRSCGEARHAGPAFQHKTFAPLDAPPCIDSLSRGGICIGVPMPECLARTGPCGWEQGGATPLEEGPPRERSCVEAVMDYLDGPIVGDFDFMFAEEEGGAAVVEYLALGCSISEADIASMLSNDR